MRHLRGRFGEDRADAPRITLDGGAVNGRPSGRVAAIDIL